MRACVCCVLLLAACHKGPAARVETHGIQVQSATTRVTAGGAGITISAIVSGGASSVSWTLSGPGSLSQNSGPTTVYTPPTCLDQPTKATVMASAEGASASTTLAIAPPEKQQACIAITPESGEVTIGDNPLPFTATVSTPNTEVTWSLFGPGSIAPATGLSTVYTPPESLGSPIDVTITATAGAVSAHAVARANPRIVYPVGQGPVALAFDGANIWVANGGDRTLNRVRPSDGAVTATLQLANEPTALLFDGRDLWVGEFARPLGDGVLERVRVGDGTILTSFSAGSRVARHGLGWDGSNLWIQRWGGAIEKVRASDGTVLATIPTSGGVVSGYAFDGELMWAAFAGSKNVMRIRAADGAPLGELFVGGDGSQFANQLFFESSGVLDAWLPGPAYYYGSHTPVPQGTLTRIDPARGYVLDSGAFGVSSDDLGGSVEDFLFDGKSYWFSGGHRIIQLDASTLSLRRNAAVLTPGALVSDGTHVWAVSLAYNCLVRL